MPGENPAGASLAQNAKRLLASLDAHAKKSLGQHFLIDAGALRKIVDAADLTPEDTVIEVGPGLGVLTSELVKRAGKVIAVELDDELAELLKKTLSGASNLTNVHRDILKVAPSTLLKEAGLPEDSTYKVVANLPYYITSAVLRHFLEADARPAVMVVTVQKEVAKAITALPGQMSLLGVAVQFYGEARIVGKIPPGSFMPAPKVESAVLKIRLRPQLPIDVCDTQSFFDIVRAGFCANRKQLINSLTQGLGQDKTAILAVIEKAGIEPSRRAETLTIDEWVTLWRAFHEGAIRC
jgi:16S rRNA (adenine1518-N6/adenine1519-N6)-dimethyltransferase